MRAAPGTDVAPPRGMATTPRLSGLDHTLAFLREGYDFLPRRFERLDTDLFEARLALRTTVCMRGRAAAEVFYDSERFRRRGAAPGRVKKTLFGRGGVQGLDGEAHRRRKAMFMSLMDDRSIDRLVGLVEEHWRRALPAWARQGRVELLTASGRVLLRAVCEWAGVPLPEEDVERRARQMSRLIEGAGGVGPRYWKGRVARKRANAWIADVIGRIRGGELPVPAGSAAEVVARYREDGAPLPSETAAVELLNLLRPTVAINRYITFSALALHEHAERLGAIDPAWDRDAEGITSFVHEVRRYYPFFPFVGARVQTPFEWHGHAFEPGRLVLLDLFGTNRDPDLYAMPDEFRADRFRGRTIDPFSLIPQGGGDHHRDHRCAGEWITIAVTRAAVRLLTREMRYDVPEQDLSVDHARIPARPASGFVIEVADPSERNVPGVRAG